MIESTGIRPLDLDFVRAVFLCGGSGELDSALLARPSDGALMMLPQLGQGPLTPAMEAGTESCLPQAGHWKTINEVASCGTGMIPVTEVS